MRIKFTKVTWYSQVVAVALFVGVFFLGFSLGKMAEREYINAGIAGVETTTASTSLPSDNVIDKVTFACAQGKTIKASFMQAKVTIVLSDGRNLTLAQTLSASGARYANANESVIFWNKGNGATLQEGTKNTYVTCYAQ